MFTFLSQPYPREPRNLRQWLLTSAGTGAFVTIFLLVFQPFGAAQWDDPMKPYVLSGFGVVTFVCLSFFGLIFPAAFKSWFAERTWTVGKEILWSSTNIGFIALGNMLYSGWMFGGGYGNLVLWLGITAAIGVIPMTVMTLVNYTRLLRKYATADLRVGRHEPETTAFPLPETITFTAENEKDALTVAVADLLFIESADNYSEIVFLQNEKTKKALLRGSLSRFEEQAHYPDVVRCHRSYVVNLQQVEGISGNAQGYKLQLKNYPLPIPVARRYGDLVAGYFKK